MLIRKLSTPPIILHRTRMQLTGNIDCALAYITFPYCGRHHCPTVIHLWQKYTIRRIFERAWHSMFRTSTMVWQLLLIVQEYCAPPMLGIPSVQRHCSDRMICNYRLLELNITDYTTWRSIKVLLNWRLFFSLHPEFYQPLRISQSYTLQYSLHHAVQPKVPRLCSCSCCLSFQCHPGMFSHLFI